ncbi:MAG: T9SS type A sorting domain-containing protein [Fidelibacterota bacterium]
MNWMQTRSTLIIIILYLMMATVNCQPQVEFLGLEGKLITSLGMYGSAIVIGTDGDGVFYQYTNKLPDSSWINVGLEGKNVTAVYPHKSGPLMWGIAAGIWPEEGDSDYVYCSSVSNGFEPNSDGITDDLVHLMYRLAGFPDPSICGEKYAATGPALYRQWWGDSLWTVVWNEECIEGCQLVYVRTGEKIGLGGLVVAGGNDGFGGPILIKSLDYGETWESLSEITGSGILAFDFSDNSDYSDIEEMFVSHGARISRSLNGGSTWDVVYEDGWNYFSEIIYNPYSSLVFAAGGDGLDTSSAVLFFSEDLGENWVQVPLSFGGPIEGIEMSSDGYIYIAAPWSGVFRIDLDELSIEDLHLPLSFALHQNYPNPFNPSTTIRFDLPEATDVELIIYDILGRKVQALVSGQLVSGKHEVMWNASNVASGVYYYQLTTPQDATHNNSLFTKKMVVLK